RSNIYRLANRYELEGSQERKEGVYRLQTAWEISRCTQTKAEIVISFEETFAEELLSHELLTIPVEFVPANSPLGMASLEPGKHAVTTYQTPPV
ncbi:hypothetical protein PHET_08595, partial [Paragonimus heterotremus]